MHSTTQAPALFSFTRLASFLTCLLVALASGTNYVYSAYAPQLGSRLGLSHTQLNIVGLSGNIGVYGSAPLWGRIVDTRGPRGLFVMAFCALVVGYSGIRHFYDQGLPEGESKLGLLGICMLVFFSFLTGIGGNGGLASSMNSTAKSWPDRARATANGIVISGFGLSAFLFSTIVHVVFPGNTSDFLLVLAVGTSIPMILGFFLVHPIPLPLSELTHTPEDEAIEEAIISESSAVVPSPSLFERDNNSHTHLLFPHTHHHHTHVDDEDVHSDHPFAQSEEAPLTSQSHHPQRSAVVSDYFVPNSGESVALSPTRGPPNAGRHRSRSSFSISRRSIRSLSPITAMKGIDAPNISGKGLFVATDFWLIFSITALLSGTGLMYINNAGSISQALFAMGNPDYDEAKAAQWQSTQVSIISVMNCSGRFFIGMLADLTKNYMKAQRSFSITLVASIFIVSQVTCYYVDDVSDLWKASALLGLAYGSMFGLFPTICIEWFGLPHFSENWGFVSLAPMLGSNVFSLAFGRNLDAHVPDSSNTAPSVPPSFLSRARLPSSQQCLQGRACYADSIKLTIAACCIALVLSIYAGWRDHRRNARITLKGTEVVHETVWEEDEEEV